ncbi:rhomboid family intramembrane serine protease [Moraxella sp. ZJ142]|uniref:rhomboid family intramembrane serine protease n=1 Tax=Moraxella marmotae TaxID=3344520 RepID=UPI0035D4325F
MTLWRLTPATLGLIVCFVLLAVIQWLMGVNIDNPSTADLLAFGANFLPRSMFDEPWRLVSAGFLHIGILHLLFNGFAMYYFGQVVEVIVGSVQSLLVFVLAVAGGNLLSNYLAWQAVLVDNMPAVSAGASGGIIGMGAFLLVLAVFRSPTPVPLNTKGLAIVMAVNLTMGFAIDGIDNAGHIGGFLVGLLLGGVHAYTLNKQQAAGRWLMGVSLVVAAGFGLLWYVLHWQILAVIGMA